MRIDYDRATNTYFIERPDARVEASMDRKYERTAPGELRWKGGMRGLGDLIKRGTQAIGIPQCGGCKDRQEWLNKLVPFGGP